MLQTLTSYGKKLIREGPTFRAKLNALSLSEQLSPSELEVYQSDKLSRMIQHCYHNVPYYRALFEKLQLTPADIQTVDDLSKLPVMTKKTVQANFEALKATNIFKPFCTLGRTSGTTGSPGKFLRDYNSINFEQASLWRLWQKAGYSDKKRRVTMRGAIVVPAEQTAPPYWKKDIAANEMLMSSYHLSVENSAAYIQAILDYRPHYLYAYPSTANLLAKFFLDHDIQYQFDGIFTSSEKILPESRELLEATFRCKIFDWYGQAERVSAIANCEYGRYHIQEDYSIVETLGSPQGYELVGTQLENFAMPLLRYTTGDIVTLSDEPCACGTHFRSIADIGGRSAANFIVTPEGHINGRLDFILKNVENIIETQFCQERSGELIINVIPDQNFSASDKQKLLQNTLLYTSPRMKVVINEVSNIPRGPNGKFAFLIQKCTA